MHRNRIKITKTLLCIEFRKYDDKKVCLELTFIDMKLELIQTLIVYKNKQNILTIQWGYEL